MSQKEREQLHAEFSILASLRHPNIVAYYHRDHLKATQELHLYMEYCGGGDLGQVIKELRTANQVADEGFVWSVVSQLASALYRCHYGEAPLPVGDNVMAAPKRRTTLRTKNRVMILHRDLKPENGEWGLNSSKDYADGV
jgi:NIMA (never in mitosis gene a)-related kinase 2